MRAYGKEWQCNEEPVPDDILQYLTEKITNDPTKTLQRTVQIGSRDEKHWLLDCENTDPHSHIFMRWEAP